MSITLSTTEQVLAINMMNTIGVRLVGWYDNVNGNNADVHVKLQACSQGTSYVGTNKNYNLIVGSSGTGTISFADTLPQDTWVDVASLAQTYSGGSQVSTSGTIWTYVYGSTSVETSDVYLPTFITPPADLTVTVDSINKQSISAEVTITNWGGGCDAASRYKELKVSRNSNMTNAKYVREYGDLLTSDLTVDNEASGDSTWQLLNNGRYYYQAIATNGTSTSSTSPVEFITKLQPIIPGTAYVSSTKATIEYMSLIDGGAFPKQLECSVDGGQTWSIVATPPSDQVVNSQFTLSGLTPNTSYTVKLKTVAGAQSETIEIEFTTTGEAAESGLYGSDNDEAHKITEYYVSVNNAAARAIKIYGSVGGKTKRIY